MNDRRTGIGLIVVALTMLAGVTLLYNGSGPFDPTSSVGLGSWDPILGGIARGLTLPLRASGITDVRDVLPFVGLAAVLLIVIMASSSSAGAATQSGIPSCSGLRWLMYTSVIVVVVGIASAVVNDAMELSRGWLVRFAVGAGWAWTLGRFLDSRWVRPAIRGMVLIGATACALAVWHRVDHGARYFTWPIGTLTITAGLAAVWTALAGGLLLSPRETASHGSNVRAKSAFAGSVRESSHKTASRLSSVRFIGKFLCWIVVGAIAAYVLQQSGRRSAAIGCIAAVSCIFAFRLWSGRYRRAMRPMVLLAAVVGVLGSAWYVKHESSSAERGRSIPVAVRFGYMKLCGKLISEHPLLGVGPDMTVVHMTNAVAPLRAVSPHVYHGSIDAAVHNEWMQSAVELGVPAALAYLALPIGIVFIALRLSSRELRLREAGIAATAVNSMDLGTVLALVAGIVAVCVTEIGSITMRGPMMPPWYWTMLGLLIAASRTPQMSHAPSVKPAERAAPTPARMSMGNRAIGLAAAALCLVVAFREMVTTAAETVQADAPDSGADTRLYAEKTILARFRAAEFMLWSAQAQPQSRGGTRAFADQSNAQISAAVESWGALYQIVPGLGGVIEYDARALLLAGKPAEAHEALRRAIEEKLDPYSAGVNELYARLPDTPPLEKYRCVQRALRGSAMDDELAAILREVADDPNVIRAMETDLPSAVNLSRDVSDGKDFSGSILETLRIRAQLDRSSGALMVAMQYQEMATRAYQKMEEINHPCRRASAAETDAFEMLAHIMMETWRLFSNRSDVADAAPSPGNPMRPIQEALDTILSAERYAMLGINHQRVTHPRPDWGFVIGEVMPTEFPDRLRPLWRFSALLHLMAGRDRFIDFRVYFSLPREQWTPQDMQREMAKLAGEAMAELARLPVHQRPAHFAALQTLANRTD